MTVDFRTNSADVGFINRAVYYSLVVFLDFSGSLSFRRKIRKDLTYLAARSVCQNVKNLMNTRAGVLSANNIYANMSYNFHNEEVTWATLFFSIKVVVIPSIDVSFVILTTYALSDREYFKRNNISACDGHWELVVSDTSLISFLISAPTILPINYLYHLDFSKIATQLGNFFDCCYRTSFNQ